MIRAFVAVAPSPSFREALVKAQTELRSRLDQAAGRDVRIQWVKPESLHLTLKFLGDVAEEQLTDIQAALTRVAGRHDRFSVTAEGLGVFPDPRTPRALWIGLTDGDQALARLAADVEETLVAIGCTPETKPFSPHVTLARIKDRSREVGRILVRERLLEREWTVGLLVIEALVLMKSDLRPTGSVYTALCRAPLRET